MNIMELLQLTDERLRKLATADESTLQAVFAEVAAGPRPDGIPPHIEPRVVLAGRVKEIEAECQMLLERLHVPFTTHAHVEIKNLTTSGSVRHGSADADESE